MGNAKSKHSLHKGHEKLNEHDAKYFAKVQARNSTTRSSRRLHRVRRQLACVTSFERIETPREDDDDSLIWMDTENSSPASSDTKPALGPLPPKMKIADHISTSSFSRSSPKKLKPITEGVISPGSVRLPSPREKVFPALSHYSHHTPVQRRLEKARANQIRPTDSHSDLSIDSSSSSQVVHDYYTEMLDEAHRESRQANTEITHGSDRAFDSMIGMVWTEVTRSGRVTCVAFSRSNTREEAAEQPLLMAVGTDDGTISVIEVLDDPSSPMIHKQFDFGSSGSKKIGVVKELQREAIVRCVDFSPNGRWLIVGGDDCNATLMRINVKTSPGLAKVLSSVEVVQEFERDDRVYCCQFSPDGSKLAVGGFDGMVTIASMVNMDGAQELSPLTRPLNLVTEIRRPGLVLTLDWSADGSMLAVGGSDKRCTLVDHSWQIVGEIQRSSSVLSVKWKPLGDQVAIGYSDGTIVVDSESKRIIAEVVHGTSKTASNALCWSPDGMFLAVGGSDHCCAIVETRSFALVHEIRRSGSVTCLAWNAQQLRLGDEGRYLAIGGEDRTIAIMKTGVWRGGDDSTSVAGSDSDSNASSYFSVGSLSQHEWILREDSFRDIENDVSFFPKPAPVSPLSICAGDRSITAVAFSRHKKETSSRYLVTAKSNGSVLVTGTIDWRTVQQMIFRKTVNAAHFSRTSDILVLGGEDGIVHVVSTADWHTMKEIKVTSSSVRAIRFSRSDERLAVGCSDGALALLNPANGWKIAGEIDQSESCVSCIDFSSKHLAVGRYDGTVAIYEASRVYANFFVPEAELSRDAAVNSVAFGVKGQFLAAGDASGKVGVYSQKGGWVECHKINTAAGSVLATKWSSGGQYLAFGGEHHALGARVVDTATWTNVKALHKLEKEERLIALEWSNDDEWLVLACANGSSHMVRSAGWQVHKSFPYLAISSEPQLTKKEVDCEQSRTSNGTDEARNRYTDILEGGLSWHESPQVVRFLAMAETFLDAHQETDPLPALRPLLKCVLILTIHVKWLATKDRDATKRICRCDDGEPFVAVMRILSTCTDTMKHVMRESDRTKPLSYSTSFRLSHRDLRRVRAWNEQWLSLDAKASRIDIAILQDADEAH